MHPGESPSQCLSAVTCCEENYTHGYREDALGVSFSETIIATTLAVDNVARHFPHNLYNGKKLEHSHSHGSFLLLFFTSTIRARYL